MGAFVKGDVVVVPFPFSDLTATKRRPALVLTALSGQDVILCQITSRSGPDSYALPLSDLDFVSGGLKLDSSVRPDRIFTADSSIVLYRAGRLAIEKTREIVGAVVRILGA